jgi:hypothetical protein
LVPELLMVVTAVSSAPSAPPTLLKVVPWIRYEGGVSCPEPSSPAPPPNALATRWLAVNNWPPLTASVELSAILPGARLTSLRSPPTVPIETVLATSASEPCPSATAPAAVADAP